MASNNPTNVTKPQDDPFNPNIANMNPPDKSIVQQSNTFNPQSKEFVPSTSNSSSSLPSTSNPTTSIPLSSSAKNPAKSPPRHSYLIASTTVLQGKLANLKRQNEAVQASTLQLMYWIHNINIDGNYNVDPQEVKEWQNRATRQLVVQAESFNPTWIQTIIDDLNI